MTILFHPTCLIVDLLVYVACSYRQIAILLRLLIGDFLPHFLHGTPLLIGSFLLYVTIYRWFEWCIYIVCVIPISRLLPPSSHPQVTTLPVSQSLVCFMLTVLICTPVSSSDVNSLFLSQPMALGWIDSRGFFWCTADSVTEFWQLDMIAAYPSGTLANCERSPWTSMLL